MYSTITFLSAIVAVVLTTPATPTIPCCYPLQYEGVHYNKIITQGNNSFKSVKRVTHTYIDYVNEIEFNKYLFISSVNYRYQVLSDYSVNGYTYVTAYGTCLYKMTTTIAQSERCRFCTAQNWGPFHYGAGGNKLYADYYNANFTTETTEGTPVNPQIHATMIHINPQIILPVLEYGIYNVGNNKIHYRIDHTNYVLKITDVSVFVKPFGCEIITSVTKDQLYAMIMEAKDNSSE